MLLRYDKDKTYCLIDCETCNLGLNEQLNLPFQVSILKARGNDILQEFDFYIKWPEVLKMSKRSAEMTGYDPQIIKEKGVEPEIVLNIIDKELKEADFILGHNILGFDIYIIQSLYRKLNKNFYNFLPKLLDTFPIAKAIKLEIPYNKGDNFTAFQYRLYHFRAKGIKCSLSALGKEYHVPHDYEKLHNSLYDIQLNWKVWNQIKYLIEI
jgi:DNA polymerase III alpha subunit (gram-positive type)